MREDYRLFMCAFCHALVRICSHCDRGQRYCSKECARRRRLELGRQSGRTYQKTPAGRRNHARRQAKYRRRQRDLPAPLGRLNVSQELLQTRTLERRRTLARQHLPGLRRRTAPGCVTHQGTPHRWQAGMVTVMRVPTPSRVTPNHFDNEVRCDFCGVLSQPFARLGFIRERRRYGRRG